MRLSNFFIENDIVTHDDLSILSDIVATSPEEAPLHKQIIDLLKSLLIYVDIRKPDAEKEEQWVDQLQNQVESLQEHTSPAEIQLQKQIVDNEEEVLNLINADPRMQRMINNLVAQATAEKLAGAEEKGFKRGAKAGFTGGFEKGEELAQVSIETNKKKIHNMAKQLIKRFDEPLSRDNGYISQFVSMFDNKNLHFVDVEHFLKGAIGGNVIRLDDMVDNPVGNLLDYVNDDYRHIFEKISKEFMALKNPNATRGSLGPGELAIVLLGSPVEKAIKGDLKIGHGKEAVTYELKASKFSKKFNKQGKELAPSESAGRLTGDNMPRVKPLLGKILKLQTKYFDIKKENLLNDKGVPKFSFNSGRDDKNGRTGIKFLNDISSTVNNRRKKMVGFLTELFELFLPSVDRKIIHRVVDKRIVEKDGSIDDRAYGKFFQGYMKLNYIEYASDGMFDALMFLNQDTHNYMIVDNSEQLANLIKQRKIKISKGVSFTDPQNPAAPAVFTK